MQLVLRSLLCMFALVTSFAALAANAATHGYTLNGGTLEQVDLATGSRSNLFSLGDPGAFTGLAIAQDRYLYAVHSHDDALYRIDLNASSAVVVGTIGAAGYRVGLDVDEVGVMRMTNPSTLYEIDTATGAATVVGALGVADVDAISSFGGVLYGVSVSTESLYTIDTTTGTATLVGAFGAQFSVADQMGLSFDETGVLHGLATEFFPPAGENTRMYTFDLGTGAATLVASWWVGFGPAYPYSSLAIDHFIDTDVDGMPDFWEDQYGFDKNSAADATGDADSDGLTNLDDYNERTNPLLSDTDGDGLSDAVEVSPHGTNPTDADSDADGLSDGQEVLIYGTDPLSTDTDADEMSDLYEIVHGLDPDLDDTGLDLDSDTWTNFEEFSWGTPPNDPGERPAAREAYAISSDNDLVRIELLTGNVTVVGPINLAGTPHFISMTFGPDHMLYAADAASNGYYRIDPDTAAITPFNLWGFDVTGLATDTDERIWAARLSNLREVSTSTGNTISVGFMDEEMEGLAFDGDTLYGVGYPISYQLHLYAVDRSNASAVSLGQIIPGSADSVGLTSDTGGRLIVTLRVVSSPVQIFRVDPHTLEAVELTTLPASPIYANLAIDFLVDTDSDGLLDYWEDRYGLDWESAADAGLDGDADGLTNLEENDEDTDPTNADTDGDGMTDGWEVGFFLDPLVDDAAGDADSDTFTNVEEFNAGTDPTDAGSQPNPPAVPGLGWLAMSGLTLLLGAFGARQIRRPAEPDLCRHSCM